MKKIILLSTAWESNFWEIKKDVPYLNRSYTSLDDWNNLATDCPLPGIGIYIKQKNKDFFQNPFVYLKILGLDYDPNSKEPHFTFKSIQKSDRTSEILFRKLPLPNKNLFSTIEPKKLLKILENIGEKPPKEWQKLIEIKKVNHHWEDYIGKYFLDLDKKTLGNNEYEDRIYHLLNSLGFIVEQKGYKTPGQYPDGIARLNDYILVYDCKNSRNFIPNAADMRAITKYAEDEKAITKGNCIGVFIAKSFKKEPKKDVLFLPIRSLLYLLYKKLFLGSKFDLSLIIRIFRNYFSLEKELINNEWRT